MGKGEMGATVPARRGRRALLAKCTLAFPRARNVLARFLISRFPLPRGGALSHGLGKMEPTCAAQAFSPLEAT